MLPPRAHSVVHLELHTGDGEAARAFYGALFGWRSEVVDSGAGPYLALGMSGPVGGGMVECGIEPALWLPYVEVPEIFAATRRAEELGATVLLPPREGPAGWRSVVSLPAGGQLACWQQKR